MSTVLAGQVKKGTVVRDNDGRTVTISRIYAGGKKGKITLGFKRPNGSEGMKTLDDTERLDVVAGASERGPGDEQGEK